MHSDIGNVGPSKNGTTLERGRQSVGFAGRPPGLNVGSEAKQLPGRLLGCQRSSKPIKLQKSLQLSSLQINSSQVISLKLW